MLKTIFNWFTGKPLPGTEAPAVKAESAPYKVEPAPVVKVAEPAPVAQMEPVTPLPATPKKRAPAVKKPVSDAPKTPRTRKKTI
jgi:hypothetical protein